MKLGIFDRYEVVSLDASEIVNKIGKRERLPFYDTNEFKERQFTVKVWEATVSKDWIPSNLRLELADTDHIWYRVSSIYSLFAQLPDNKYQFIEPITIFHRRGKYYVETGLHRYSLNRILEPIELKAYIVDADAVFTETKDIQKEFSIDTVAVTNSPEIKLDWATDWQNSEPCYQYITKPKFFSEEFANEHTSIRLEFLSIINNYKNSLTFWHKGVKVGKIDNNNPMLNVELYNIEGLAQFVLEQFCDHHEFRIEKQYRIME